MASSTDLNNSLKIMGLETTEAFRDSCFSTLNRKALEGLKGDDLHKALETQIRAFLHTGSTNHDRP